MRPTVQRILDSITAPAYVRNGRLDILAANTLGYAALLSRSSTTRRHAEHGAVPLLEPAGGRVLRRLGHHRQRRRRHPARRGRPRPLRQRLSDLIGELSTRSDEFRVRWAAHNVKFHRTGAKTLHHPVVGDLTLDYEALDLPGDAGQRILVYSAEPGKPFAEALDLLASWASTPASARVVDD